jgi:hypothetical protein
MAHEGTHVRFITTKIIEGSISFDSYLDVNDKQIGIQIGTERNTGYPIFKRFTWTPEQDSIWIPKGDKKTIKFLEESPFCNGSELSVPGQTWYKRFDLANDAKIANEKRSKSRKAGRAAEELKGDDLEQVAVLCGCFVGVEDIQRHRVESFAEANPDEFMKIIDGPDRKARSLVRSAKESGVLHTKGKMIMWIDVFIGSDEDDAVAKLMKEPKLLEALQTAYEKKLKTV